MSQSQLFTVSNWEPSETKSPFPRARVKFSAYNTKSHDHSRRHLCRLSDRRKASYSIEASVALPVFMGFVVCILFFIRVLMTGWAIDDAMTKAVDTAAVCEDPSVFMAEALFYKELLSGDVKMDAVMGGAPGIVMAESSADEKNITLCATYRVNLPIRMFSDKGIFLYQTKSARIWNGYDPKEDSGDDIYVYVTPYGKAYHRSKSCPYINPSIRGVSLSKVPDMKNSGGGKYKICPMCKRDVSDTVYVTSWGECYHGSISCSGLKRTITMIKLSEAEEKYHACPKCGGE